MKIKAAHEVTHLGQTLKSLHLTVLLDNTKLARI